MDDNSEWYWDLTQRKAVPAAERGRDEDTLGPYPSRAAAEHWKEQVDRRNEAWDDADDAWNDDD